jgi:preprotein translocase subunit SecD
MYRFVRRLMASVVACLAVCAGVWCGASASSYPSRTGAFAVTGTSMLLCAPSGTTTQQMSKALTIVRRRVHHGFHFHSATVKASSSDCISVTLAHQIKWRGWLATDISSIGRFGIGVSVPSATQHLTTGAKVRYKKDPVTATNSNLPVVKVVIGRPGVRGYTAKYQRQNGYDYVGVDLTPTGSKTLCTFTKNHVGKLAVVVLDHRVVSDERVSAKICGGSILTGFPIEKSLDKPLGPREIIADLHSGPLPVSLSVTSLA